jgi:hypothetical protein
MSLCLVPWLARKAPAVARITQSSAADVPGTGAMEDVKTVPFLIWS